MYFIRKYQQLAQSDCQRIEAISKGPVNSRYTSAIDGITTIRVYHKEQYFYDSFLVESDINSSARFTLAGVIRWFIMRLDI
jgi:enoyl-[acyl-carrier-protein] reductase (NADH)